MSKTQQKRIEAQSAVPTTCNWFQDSEDQSDLYDTTCGNRYFIIDGTPTDNGFLFCCYCGKPLTQTLIEPEQDNDC